eukprot:7376095-Prymnesium_polylepis.1
MSPMRWRFAWPGWISGQIAPGRGGLPGFREVPDDSPRTAAASPVTHFVLEKKKARGSRQHGL